MTYNGYATPVALTPITVAFYVTNIKENGEDHETRIGVLEAFAAAADATTLDGHDSTYFATAAAVAALNTVPSGVIAAFATAAAIASGWARYTNLDGRIPVGAGTTFTVTYVEDTAYGSSWSHGHTGGAHAHNASALGVSGSTGTPDDLEQKTGSGNDVASDGHKHNQGTLDVTGTTDSGGAVSTSSDAWVIPSRAVVWAQKS